MTEQRRKLTGNGLSPHEKFTVVNGEVLTEAECKERDERGLKPFVYDGLIDG